MSMLPASVLENPWVEPIAKQSYLNLQWGKSYFSVAHKTFFGRVKSWVYPQSQSNTEALNPSLLKQLQARIEEILEQDWQDAKAGVYPVDLLFDDPWDDFIRFYPQMCFDIPATWNRARENRNQDFAPELEIADYPSYYLQNFHYQTDGYLSDQSANFYDMQVELLFGGRADAMRRRILAPLKRSLLASFGSIPSDQWQILDIACGTGRTLRQLRGAFPMAQLHGVDLSKAYLRKANQRLSKVPGKLPQLCCANAEESPYADESFHGLTSVFLLHELPPNARHAVLEDSFRLLKPGGCLVICDSIQLQDSPEFAPMMTNFATLFHEPYYQSYVDDDLVARLTQIGYEDIQSHVHFFSKYLIAHKKSGAA